MNFSSGGMRKRRISNVQQQNKSNSKFDRRVAIEGIKAAVVAINYMLHHRNSYSVRLCNMLQEARTNALNLLDSMMNDEEDHPTVDIDRKPLTKDDEGIPF